MVVMGHIQIFYQIIDNNIPHLRVSHRICGILFEKKLCACQGTGAIFFSYYKHLKLIIVI